VLVVSGHYEANADMMPTLRVIDIEADMDAAIAAVDVLAETSLESPQQLNRQLTPRPAVQHQPAIPEELAPFAVAEGEDEHELVRQLSTRMSLRRGSLGTPLRRQLSKAA
jgi:hypothetical protein